MAFIIFPIGVIIGVLLNVCTNKISNKIFNNRVEKFNKVLPLITGIIFLLSFLKFNLNVFFIKAIVLGSILIVVSFIDLKHRVIPNKLVILTLIFGIIFSFISDISFSNSILGMILGGGLLFLLGLIPSAMGGGDIKLMFALGSYLGYIRTLWALILAFSLASVISILLLLFKIKGKKDQIPFGPFLAAGTFISYLYLR